MRTFDQMHDDCNKAGQPCAYFGESGDWLCAAGRSRDSDILEASNWQALINLLDKLGDEPEAYRIESEGHWAVGWVETLLINPGHPEAIAIAEKAHEDLEQYPILDEGLLSEMEIEMERDG